MQRMSMMKAGAMALAGALMVLGVGCTGSGAPGPKGDTGLAGPPGAKGDPGERGPQGPGLAYERTVVVSPGATPEEGGQRLRQALAGTANVILLEAGNYQLDAAPLVLPSPRGGLVIRGAGREATYLDREGGTDLFVLPGGQLELADMTINLSNSPGMRFLSAGEGGSASPSVRVRNLALWGVGNGGDMSVGFDMHDGSLTLEDVSLSIIGGATAIGVRIPSVGSTVSLSRTFLLVRGQAESTGIYVQQLGFVEVVDSTLDIGTETGTGEGLRVVSGNGVCCGWRPHLRNTLIRASGSPSSTTALRFDEGSSYRRIIISGGGLESSGPAFRLGNGASLVATHALLSGGAAPVLGTIGSKASCVGAFRMQDSTTAVALGTDCQ